MARGRSLPRCGRGDVDHGQYQLDLVLGGPAAYPSPPLVNNFCPTHRCYEDLVAKLDSLEQQMGPVSAKPMPRNRRWFRNEKAPANCKLAEVCGNNTAYGAATSPRSPRLQPR
jgi:hypothetical protein